MRRSTNRTFTTKCILQYGDCECSARFFATGGQYVLTSPFYICTTFLDWFGRAMVRDAYAGLHRHSLSCSRLTDFKNNKPTEKGIRIWWIRPEKASCIDFDRQKRRPCLLPLLNESEEGSVQRAQFHCDWPQCFDIESNVPCDWIVEFAWLIVCQSLEFGDMQWCIYCTCRASRCQRWCRLHYSLFSNSWCCREILFELKHVFVRLCSKQLRLTDDDTSATQDGSSFKDVKS